MQLIDKQELLRTLEQDIDVSVTGQENMEAVRKCLQEILDDVKESPVVDAVPVKHGKWLAGDRMPDYPRVPYKIYETYCSECRSEGDSDYEYCPHCGARMDEDEID